MDYYSNTMEYDDHYQRSYEESYYYNHRKAAFIISMLMWAIGIVSLPLNGAFIYATFSRVQKDIARIYVINLQVSDLLQLCSAAAMPSDYGFFSYYIYWFGLMVSVGFRMCIASERCSVVFCPQGFCFRTSVKVCAVVCFLVWFFPLCFFISFTVLGPVEPILKAMAIFLLLPSPFIIATLVVALTSLCAANSITSNVKHRAVGSVVLLVFVHMLLIIPFLISLLSGGTGNHILDYVLYVTPRLSPLADTFLYFFLTKRDTQNNLGNSVNRSVMNDESSHINSSV